MVEFLALILFALGYVFISFEQKFRTSKAAIALIVGGFLWILVVLSHKPNSFLESTFKTTGNEILGIIMFLFASMALVEVMSHHHLFDVIRQKLSNLQISVKKQFILLTILTFFLSALLDNMTVGLLMIVVAKQFFKGKNLLGAAAGIVIASNAGGSWSPIGDVTTVLLWIAGKYTSLYIIKEAFLPALTFLLVSCGLLLRQIDNQERLEHKEEKAIKLSLKDKIIIVGSICSFLLPIFANNIGLPPYIGLLFGLGVVWTFLQFENSRNENSTDIMAELFKKVDIASINFYAGILLAANALQALGLLEYLSKLLFGATQQFFHVVWGAIAAGLIFATFDNIPLTAVSLKLITIQSQSLWILLAITIGNGGSTLIIGSAAGIAVMSGLRELTVTRFFKIAFVPTILAYAAMVAVWFVQYLFIK